MPASLRRRRSRPELASAEPPPETGSFLAGSGEHQVQVSGGDPGAACRASCTCCLSSLTHRGADSRDARGQLLTGAALDSMCPPTRGLRGSAAKGMQRCQWGWRRSRSWQGGAGGQARGGRMPSAGGERPGFTVILSDDHFPDPKAAGSSCSGGLWRSCYVHAATSRARP